jgi:hypothetical protein
MIKSLYFLQELIFAAVNFNSVTWTLREMLLVVMGTITLLRIETSTMTHHVKMIFWRLGYSKPIIQSSFNGLFCHNDQKWRYFIRCWAPDALSVCKCWIKLKSLKKTWKTYSSHTIPNKYNWFHDENYHIHIIILYIIVKKRIN